MKIVYWLISIVIAIPTLYIGAIYGASELGGEVVTLDRADANGEVSQVRIWIVDQDDTSWVEHGEAESFWINRLTESPEVGLRREGQEINYVGTPDKSSHDLYHKLRQEKYGWADSAIALLTGATAECEGVPVRLRISAR